MCGRYSQGHRLQEVVQEFQCDPTGIPENEFVPRFNISPGQRAPVVVVESDRRLLKAFQWGLIPSWANDVSMGARCINARSETVLEKPAFRAAFKCRRALVVADGFYEWARSQGGGGSPMRFQLKTAGVFAFAGLWERWCSDSSLNASQLATVTEVETFTILTTQANDLVAPLHPRMPVILEPGHYKLWMDPSSAEKELVSILRPYPGNEMLAYPVSSRVNSTAHEDPECAQPFRSPQTELNF